MLALLLSEQLVVLPLEGFGMFGEQLSLPLQLQSLLLQCLAIFLLRSLLLLLLFVEFLQRHLVVDALLQLLL